MEGVDPHIGIYALHTHTERTPTTIQTQANSFITTTTTKTRILAGREAIETKTQLNLEMPQSGRIQPYTADRPNGTSVQSTQYGSSSETPQRAECPRCGYSIDLRAVQLTGRTDQDSEADESEVYNSEVYDDEVDDSEEFDGDEYDSEGYDDESEDKYIQGAQYPCEEQDQEEPGEGRNDEENNEGTQDQICTICYERFDNDIHERITTACGHSNTCLVCITSMIIGDTTLVAPPNCQRYYNSITIILEPLHPWEALEDYNEQNSYNCPFRCHDDISFTTHHRIWGGRVLVHIVLEAPGFMLGELDWAMDTD